MEEVKQTTEDSTETTLQESNGTTAVKRPRRFVPRSLMAYGLIILGLFLIAYSGYYFFLDSTLDNMFSEKPLPTQSVIASPTADTSEKWKWYRNEKLKFAFEYPSYLNDNKREHQWGVEIDCGCMVFRGFEVEAISSSQTPREWWEANGKKIFNGDIGENNKYHPEVKTITEMRTDTIANQEVLVVDAKSSPPVRDKTIRHGFQEIFSVYIISKNDVIYLITDYLSIPENKLILATFQFLDDQSSLQPTKYPDDQVVCTLDAKLCPDGSSVGRTGPNCEFAPCPGS